MTALQSNSSSTTDMGCVAGPSAQQFAAIDRPYKYGEPDGAMNERMLKLMYDVYVLAAFLQMLNRMVGDEHSSDETVRESLRLAGAMEDHPEPVQDALMKWMREKQCPLEDVPAILATEAYLIERVGELEQSLYREKPRIMVAEGAGLQWLLERLVEKYETEEGLADHLHVEMFTQLPEILRRARKVRPLVLGQEVPLGLSRRYREAVQSYLSGHAIACCVLLRAVVETALKEALERHTGERVSFDYRTLGPLIDDSEKFRLFPGEIVKRCREIKRLGDNAAHDDRVLALNEAHEALAATQQVLKCVFQGTIGSAPPPG